MSGRPVDTIRVGYAYSPKDKQFRARAYVGSGPRDAHTRTVAFGDTAQEAMDCAVEYVRDIYRRERLEINAPVVKLGRVRAALLDGFSF